MGTEPRVSRWFRFRTSAARGDEQVQHIRDAVKLLEARGVDFEFDGEMAPDTALDSYLLEYYPFTRLSGPANVLVMPSLHAANIAYKLVEAMEAADVIGPILVGLEKPVQIVRLGATVNDILNMAALAAIDVEY